MKYTIMSMAALAMLATTASAKEFEGPCVNIIANYENAAPTKCVFYDSNTPETKAEEKKAEVPVIVVPDKPKYKPYKGGPKGKKHRT